jgi:hypothetical protein
MEVNFTPVRGGILARLLVIFFFLGGFGVPGEVYFRQFTKAWYLCIAIFLVGAGMVSIVDHWAGTVERSNLRILYIILGVILMAVAILWQSVLRGRMEEFMAFHH